jgi:hypothetical protein
MPTTLNHDPIAGAGAGVGGSFSFQILSVGPSYPRGAAKPFNPLQLLPQLSEKVRTPIVISSSFVTSKDDSSS